MDAGGILRRIDFNSTRNDFGAVEIDLVRNVLNILRQKTIWFTRSILGTTETILL
jgi:hypothetical protein